MKFRLCRVLGLCGLLLVFQSCGERSRDISNSEAVLRAAIINQCFAARQDLFLVQPRSDKFAEVRGLMLVPPESALAPYTVEQYRSDQLSETASAQVVQIIEAGSEFVMESVWLLQSFESSGLAVLVLIQGHGGHVDASQLTGFEWSTSIGDGELRGKDFIYIAGKEFFNEKFVLRCAGKPQS